MSHESQRLLDVQHLSLSFGSVRALDDLSFVACAGEITALIGPEGAGKSSVVNCVTGFRRPHTGRIELHCGGARPLLLERMEPCAIAREGRVARIFRNPRLFTGMSVLENVLVAHHRAGSFAALLPATRNGARKAADKARHWLDITGVAQHANHVAGALAPATQRRVEIARALATEPRLICMDEPANGLSVAEAKAFARLLRELCRQGVSLLLTSEDLHFADLVADRAVALDHGASIAAGAPGKLASHSAVLRAYLGLPAGGDMVPRIPASC